MKDINKATSLIIGSNNTIITKIDSTDVFTNNTNQIIICPFYTDDNIKRTEAIVSILDKFLSKYKNYMLKPTIRCYGLFSDLAMIPSLTIDHSDRNFLLQEERKKFLALIKCDFQIKQIISLDIDYIIKTRGYSDDQLNGRVAELDSTLSTVKFDTNLEIVFDSQHRKMNCFILGNEVLIDSKSIDKHAGYNETLFTNTEKEIMQKTKEFDRIFMDCTSETTILMKQLRTNDKQLITKFLAEIRQRVFYENLP